MNGFYCIKIVLLFSAFIVISIVSPLVLAEDVAVDTDVDAIASQTMIDINKADAEALAAALDGIGLVKAQAIVAYRDENGPFITLAELEKVQGVGKATVEKNQHIISLNQ